MQLVNCKCKHEGILWFSTDYSYSLKLTNIHYIYKNSKAAFLSRTAGFDYLNSFKNSFIAFQNFLISVMFLNNLPWTLYVHIA